MFQLIKTGHASFYQLTTLQTIHMGALMSPYGFQYGSYMGIPYGANMGCATGIHLGPIWAGPYGQHIGPLWVNLHSSSKKKKQETFTHLCTLSSDYKFPVPDYLLGW